MRICDRCRLTDPIYTGVYVGGITRDLCENCYKDYQELIEVFESMKLDFMKGKNLKHIDFD